MKQFILVAILVLTIVLSMNRLEPFKEENVLRKVQIEDRVKPPNVYTTPDLGYSLETVMAHILKKCP
jgi:hypothetical protein